MPPPDETHRGVETIVLLVGEGVLKSSDVFEMQQILIKLIGFCKQKWSQNALESLLEAS